MIEYIFNIKTGQLVSEWNAYDKHMINGKIDPNPADYTEKELYQIANTESFNYGVPKGNHKKLSQQYESTHNKLDINYPKDPNLRQLATSKKKHQYVAEEDLQDGGNYVNIVGAGGEKDVRAWNKIPDSEKPKKYKGYVKWVKKDVGANQFLGFNRYLEREEKR